MKILMFAKKKKNEDLDDVKRKNEDLCVYDCAGYLKKKKNYFGFGKIDAV